MRESSAALVGLKMIWNALMALAPQFITRLTRSPFRTATAQLSGTGIENNPQTRLARYDR